MSSTTEAAQVPAPHAFRRWLRRLAFCGAASTLLISASLAFLIGTERGLQLIVRTAGQLAGPYFSAEHAQGRLLDYWRLGGVRIHVKDEVEITVKDFSFSWQPLALLRERTLHVSSAAATGLTVRILDSPKKEKKARKRIVLPELSLPLGVRIDELRVAVSRIVAKDGEDALVIHEAVAQAAAQDDHAEVLRLRADTSQFGADLSGKVRFTGAWPVQAGGSWSVPDHGINELRGTVAAAGDLAGKVAVTASMTAPAAVTLKGSAADIFNELHWQAAAESGHFRLSDLKINVPVDGALRIVEASGTVKSYRGTVAAEIHHEGYPPVQAEAKVEAADYTGLKIDYFTVKHEASELTLRGGMQWKGGFSWQAELAAKDIDPALAAAAWPGKINGHVRSSGKLAAGKQSLELHLDGVQGELRGQPFSLGGKLALADKKLTIDGLELDSALAKARISGTADAAKQISLSVQAEAADLAAFTPEAGGSLKLEGSAIGPAENAAVTLHLNGSQLKFRNHALSALEVTAAALLTDSGSGLTAQEISVLADGKAALQLRGSLGWKNGLSWQAELKAAGLDPGLLAPDWPGAINAELRSQGSRTADNLAAAVQIDKLDGSLRGFPLQGSGKAAFDGTTLTVDRLRLQSGSTFVQASGTADIKQALALSFKAGSDNLASLAPAAAGSFQLEGAVSGTAQQPALSLTASGSKLRFQDYSLKELKAAVKADLSPSEQVDAEIKADGVQIKQDAAISTALLRAKGSAAQHQIDLAVAGSPGTLRLAAAGGWQEQQWQGQLADMQIENKQFGMWKTEKAADLLLSAQRCSLSGFALAQDKVRAAVSGSWQQGAGWQAQVQAEQLSLDLLKKWQLPVPESFPAMQGVLAVSAAAQSTGAVPQQAELTVSLPELALTAENYDEDDGETTWRWRDNQIAAKLKNDTLRLTARTTFQDGSTATLDAAASNCGDFRQPEQMPLSGKAVINIMDIAPLTQLTNYAVQTQGGFGGTVDLHGTAAKPRLDGLLALKQGLSGEGKIHVPAAGIDVTGLRLALQGDGSSNQLDATAVSGQGTLRASGEISRKSGQPLAADFSIKGENFQAAALPEYNVLISPDLKLQYSGKGTALSGKIAIPKAKIAPKGFSGAVSSSKDVAVVDGEDGPAANSLPFSAAIALDMGKDVAVDAFGFKGFLDGGLKISAKPEQTVTALGAIYLRDASVDFEGVALQLTEGRIFYQGGPIDQPGLDIRASKTVNKVEAGIHLTGSVDDMNIKLFSDTPMQDSEILSWLLSGQNSMSSSRDGNAALSPAAAALSKVGGGALLKSVNPLAAIDMEDFIDVSIGGGKEASDVSLVMGKEIYKDLYISYGKDLTGEGGSFKARYDLKYGFSVETETTAKTTGADLIWSLEK